MWWLLWGALWCAACARGAAPMPTGSEATGKVATKPAGAEVVLPRTVGPVSPAPPVATAGDADTPWWHGQLRSMTLQAPVIVVATVQTMTAFTHQEQWSPKALISTKMGLKIHEAWKGSAAPRVTVVVPGGCVGTQCVTVDHVPRVMVGERALFFLEPGPKGAYTIVGHELGKITLDGRYLRPESGEVAVTEADLAAFLHAVLEEHNTR